MQKISSKEPQKRWDGMVAPPLSVLCYPVLSVTSESVYWLWQCRQISLMMRWHLVEWLGKARYRWHLRWSLKEWVEFDRQRSRKKEVLGARMETQVTKVGRAKVWSLRKWELSCLARADRMCKAVSLGRRDQMYHRLFLWLTYYTRNVLFPDCKWGWTRNLLQEVSAFLSKP